jgi:hypothetical protein
MKAGLQNFYFPHAASLLLCVAPGMLGGCTTATTIGYDANVKVDLFAYKTYAVLPWPRTVMASASIGTLDAMAAVTRATKATMNQNGYKEVPVAEADLVLNVRGSSLPENDTAGWGLSYADTQLWTANYNPADQLPVVPGEYILVIETFQRSDAKLIWAGWRQSRLLLGPDYFWYSSAIKSILENFPPASGS